MSLSTQFVMVPLYVWPEADQTTGGHTWDPLFEAAGKHPDVQFRKCILQGLSSCMATLCISPQDIG